MCQPGFQYTLPNATTWAVITVSPLRDSHHLLHDFRDSPNDFRTGVNIRFFPPSCKAKAFDLIELNGDDMRRDPLEVRKATLRSMLAKAGLGLRFNEHMEGDGPTVFAHACKMGLEGIVSKRKDSAYRSGRSPDWLKMKNPNAPAVTREAEEGWVR